MAPPAYNWTGWHIGLNAGGTWGDDPVSTTASNSQLCPPAVCNGQLEAAQASIQGATGEFPIKTDGFIGGGQFGYDWQFANRWIAGFEADFQGLAGAEGSNSSASVHGLSGFPANSVSTDLWVRTKIDYLGTVRGRLGYLVMPSLLVFGTGGFAYGHVKSSTSISQNLLGPSGGVATSFGADSSASKVLGGWTVGGGFEWMFMPNWSAKLEYLYYDLGKVTYNTQLVDPITGAAAFPNFFVNDVQLTTRFNGNIVRVGLNYHFNP